MTPAEIRMESRSISTRNSPRSQGSRIQARSQFIKAHQVGQHGLFPAPNLYRTPSMSTWEKSVNPIEAELEHREGLTSIAMVQCVRYMPQKFVSQSVKVLGKRVWGLGAQGRCTS